MSIAEKYMSAQDAALMLNVDRSRVLVLCRQGRFDGAEKFGRDWAIPREAVENFKRLSPGGRNGAKQRQLEE